MRKNTPATPLLALLRALENDERRDEFARLAGTSRLYLYQLATCKRQSCRTPLAIAIAKASDAMAKRYGTPKIDVATLGTMCPIPE